MRLGRIVGRVWATVKDEQMLGVKLALMQPVDENGESYGHVLVAADTIGVRDGDLIFWVSGAEATRPFPDRNIPSDVTITGLVDSLDF